MMQVKRWLVVLVAGFILLNVLGLASAFVGADFLVDLWWFDSLGYGFYFWQRLLYRYVVLASVTIGFFLLFFLNFWVASRYLGTSDEAPVQARTRAIKAYKDLVTMFRTGSLWVYTPVSTVLAVIIALPLFEQWEKFLLYVFGASTGIQESTFGLDISYFLFSYPIYSLVTRRLLLAFVLLFAALVILYLVEHRVLAKRDESFPPRPNGI